ncbi:MAG TPA: flagellar motor protein MotD [Gammaproteobacteria bacterium]|nr:flagellar motor protein MotD [Gammaproteobacteria bacterium]
MARKRRPEEHENHERWLVSYADFITLLFAFFVVMYSVSQVNEGKYRVLSGSLESAFRTEPRSVTPVQTGMPSSAAPSNTAGVMQGGSLSPIQTLAREVARQMKPLLEQGLVDVREKDGWLEIEINNRILFASGSARPAEEAQALLALLGEVLGRFPNPVQVEGYTDDRPISSAVFSSNWELSAARAAVVVNLLARHGVDPAQLVALGYGENDPVADNGTPEGRARNRRVILKIFKMGRNSSGEMHTPVPVPAVRHRQEAAGGAEQ